MARSRMTRCPPGVISLFRAGSVRFPTGRHRSGIPVGLFYRRAPSARVRAAALGRFATAHFAMPFLITNAAEPPPSNSTAILASNARNNAVRSRGQRRHGRHRREKYRGDPACYGNPGQSGSFEPARYPADLLSRHHAVESARFQKRPQTEPSYCLVYRQNAWLQY